MPHAPKTHEQACVSCCGACGRGGAQLVMTNVLAELVKRYAHPSYDLNIQSYPAGCCGICKKNLYLCKKAEKNSEVINPKITESWRQFVLEDIRVPRISEECSTCPCPMCCCATFNPIGFKGKKSIVNKPIINPSGANMECEVQTAVSGRGRGRSRGICAVCGQVTGRGIQHPCSPRDVHAIREGQARSLDRVVSGRRNRNLSVLVG